MKPGVLTRIGIPASLRGSFLEGRIRTIGRRCRDVSLAVERRLRKGRVWTRLPSLEESIWLDFDFAVRVSLPASDPFLVAFLEAIRPHHVVYDIGGFVGAYAIAAARRVREGRVISFEPAPESANLLRRHCLLNGVDDRVRVVEAACSNLTGVWSMPVWPSLTTTWASGNALHNVYPREDVEPVRVPVQTVRVDDFIRAGGPVPHIVKIDVEGADLWVLEGMKQVLLEARPTVFLEMHAFAWSLFGTSEARLRDFVAEVRYELCSLEAQHGPMDAMPDYGHAILRPQPRDAFPLAPKASAACS